MPPPRMDAVEGRPITPGNHSARLSPEQADFGGADLDTEYLHVEQRHDPFNKAGNAVGQSLLSGLTLRRRRE